MHVAQLTVLKDPKVALENPKIAARAAGLRYVNAGDLGVRRVRRGQGFRYLEPSGRAITDRRTVARIRALAIPPAWTDVWICSDGRGHIQATGRDARGRKQYRYHARWRAVRDAGKFDHLIEFAESLPALRRRVQADLRRGGLSREKVLAALVHFLDLTSVRVGNDAYARDNQSFGLTTFRPRHASVSGSSIEIVFRGKSGKKHRMGLTDERLARVVRRCQELPGQKLFKYVDSDGVVCEVESGDVNTYLREVTGTEIGSKDFRTWSATVAAALALGARGDVASKTRRKKHLVEATKHAAEILGNTAAVCRRSYIHPAVIDCYLDGSLCKVFERARVNAPRVRRRRARALAEDERLVLGFLKRQRERLAHDLVHAAAA